MMATQEHLTTALAAIRHRAEELQAKADQAAALLGYAVAQNPTGDHRSQITATLVAQAKHQGAMEISQIVHGYTSGLFVPSQDK